MNIAEYIKNQLPLWPNWINAILLRCNVFGGLAYGKSYRHYCKTIDEIDPTKRLLDMVNYAIKNVPYYRDKYGDMEIHSIEDFETKIGFIDKDEVMSNWDKFIADNADLSKCITGTTGGTSGKALKLIIPKNRYSIDRAFTHRQLHKFGWNYDTFAVIRNNKLDDSKDYIINPVMKLVIFDAFKLSEEYVRTICKTMKKYHIHCIHAYPSALFQFCKLCKKVNLDLSFIKLCRLTSEQITEEEIFFFKHNFNFKLSYSYGHSERLILAGNTPSTDNYLVEESYGYLELIKKNKVIKSTGTLGEMVGTSFNNRYFPLIRYKTGDYTTYHSIGGQRILGKIQGRWQNSLIHCADGRKISTASLNLHNELYEKINGLQYLQEKKGELNILIIKGERFDSNAEQCLYSFYEKCLGNDMVINIKYVDKLILKPNGKFILLISNIN